MSINFESFIQQTGFSPTYAARKILYYPRSRPALIAKALNLAVQGEERTKMVLICAGKIKFKSTTSAEGNNALDGSQNTDRVEDSSVGEAA